MKGDTKIKAVPNKNGYDLKPARLGPVEKLWWDVICSLDNNRLTECIKKLRRKYKLTPK